MQTKLYRIDIFATRKILSVAENGSLKMILKKGAHRCVIQKRKKLKRVKLAETAPSAVLALRKT